MASLGFALFCATACSLLVLRRLRSGAQSAAIDLQASASEEDTALWIRILVTLLVLGVALYIILSPHYQSDQQKWAFGAVGTILGYWLKS